MSWRPPARPDWVRAVNAGEVPPIADEAALPFDRDALLADARARLGIDGRGVDGFVLDGFGADRLGGDGFGGEGFVEPLDVLLPALEHEAQLTVLGRYLTRRFLLR
ncbi:MAG: hypothetical protein JOZ99_01925, partial [Actinobacteria bacterium]|nr:hypothetical protein [Actinomycetota bacterium]